MFFYLMVGLLAAPHMTSAKYVMYLTGQHNVVPEASLVSEITHVALAFMRPATFNSPEVSEWPLFTTVEKVRSQFAKGTAVMVAIGGWGDTKGFSEAAATESSMKLFAKNVNAMVEQTGADGVDIDWEYPGGNGEDYKQVPNSDKAWEIQAYPKLLSSIRSALGPTKLISAAVPGLPRDMLAFTPSTIASINASLDFLNIMTYDLMNRRDTITKHHTGISLSIQAINTYLDLGIPPSKANLGFAFYVKWFKTDPDSKATCRHHPIGCKAALMEDPTTGLDLGRAGAFSWADPIPAPLATSFQKALAGGTYDETDGGHFFWDEDEDLFWSWDTPAAIARKYARVVRPKRLGGVFAWGLGEDAADWRHLTALTDKVVRRMRDGRGGESDGSDDRMEMKSREEL